MKSNSLLKWLMIPVVMLILFVLIKVLSGGNHTDADFNGTPKLTAEEMKALGIEGDTPRDTLATLVGQIKQLRGELHDTKSDYLAQKAENERLRAREHNVDQRIQQALNQGLNSEREELRRTREELHADKQQTSNMLVDLQRRLEGVGNHVELPIGLGLDDADLMLSNTLQWVEPLDVKPGTPSSRSGIGASASGAGTSFATSFKSAQDESLYAGNKIRHESYTEKNDASSLAPVYTVPANSTLMGSVAMTALIGRVPIDGTVNDPYPFKILVGADNLTANGIEIPDVAGAVLSGTASGDWTLSCVRGQIHSMTFVFNDGRVQTVSANKSGNRSGGSAGNSLSGGLGWISDSHGIPCVAGERRSNAQQYLGTQALITAAGAGAASLVESDQGNFSYMNTDGTMGKVGISGNDAVGQILMGGVRDMSQWVNKLYGQAFAAVYVEPGAQVAVHIDEEIAIDYDTQKRLVDYRMGGSSHVELD